MQKIIFLFIAILISVGSCVFITDFDVDSKVEVDGKTDSIVSFDRVCDEEDAGGDTHFE